MNFEVIAAGVPVESLNLALGGAPDLWAEWTDRQTTPGTAHADTQSIAVRWPADRSVWAAFYDLTCEDRPSVIDRLGAPLREAVQGMLRAILPGENIAEADVGRILIVSLKPDGQVARHVDTGPYADRYDRFHLVLQAEAGLDKLVVEERAYDCQPGMLLWFNHKREHAAHNFSSVVPRVHLILDVVAPAYRAKRGVTFQRERVMDIWDEFLPLAAAHKEEVAHYADIPLMVDQEFYERADATGLLRAFTARKNGTLIGYAFFIVRPNPHYLTMLHAHNDVLFIHPDHRPGTAAVRFLHWIEAQFRAEHVTVLSYHLKKKTTKTLALFDKLGFEDMDVIKVKRLDR